MTRTKQFVGLAVLATLSWWAVAGTAHAQVTTADVVGRVTDASGGALPGATVTITNPATGDTRTQVTGDTGDYTFALLPIGRYTIEHRAAGLRPVTPRRCRCRPATGQRVDAQLAVGTLAETISVTAQAPIIQSDSATVGALLPETAVQDLPLNGRNVIGAGAHGARRQRGAAELAVERQPSRRSPADLDRVGQRPERRPQQQPDRRHGQQRALHRHHRRAAVGGRDRRSEGADQHVHRRDRPHRGRGGEHPHQVGHQRLQRLGATGSSATRSSMPTTTSPAATSRSRGCGSSSGAAASAGRIIRNRTFFFADYERYHQERGVDLREHRADGGDAQRRLLGAAGPRHRHLRPADLAADAVPRQHHPGRTASTRWRSGS